MADNVITNSAFVTLTADVDEGIPRFGIDLQANYFNLTLDGPLEGSNSSYLFTGRMGLVKRFIETFLCPNDKKMQRKMISSVTPVPDNWVR